MVINRIVGEKRYQVSTQFKDECRANVGQFEKTGKIHIIEDNTDIRHDDNLIDFKIEDNCYVNGKFIGNTVAKKITVNILNPNNEINLENKEISVQTGMIINDVEEIVPCGNYIIPKPDTEELKENTSFIGYDYMIKFNIPYQNKVTYPIQAVELFKDLCNQVGLEVGNTNFVNSTYMILGNPFTNNEDCRTVLSNIAQLAGGFARIGRDNKVYIISLKNGNTEDEADEVLDGNNYLEDFSKNEQWGKVNSLILSISGEQGENTVVQDDESIIENGLTELVIEDNYFLISQAEREKVITPLWNNLKGLKYLPFEVEYYGYPYLDAGDMIYIQDTKDVRYISYVFNHTFTFNGAYSGTLKTEAMTKTQTIYKNTVTSKTKFRQVERKIDKINGVIEDVIEEQTDFSNKITQTIQDIDSITDEVHRLYNFEREAEGTNEIILEDSLPTTILELRIKPAKINTEILYPSTDLYPSLTTYPHKAGDGVTIVFGARSRVVSGEAIYPSADRYPSKDLIPIGNSSTKKFQFYFGEPLRVFNDVTDELQILFNEESGICEARVIRRIDYNNGIYTIYNIPKEDPISELTMELFKGNNYVYLEEYTNWTIYARYLFNNELNEEFAPRVETNSRIRRTADEINLEVSKKVNQDEIIASINMSPEQIKILAKNLALEGYTTINDSFSIDQEGNVSISNGAVKIDKSGIQMANGTRIVGGDGMLTQFLYTGSGQVGHISSIQWVERVAVYIPIYIPQNFVITDAVLYGQHTPSFVWRYDNGAQKLNCYARNIKLYKTNNKEAPDISNGTIFDLAPNYEGTLISDFGNASGKTFESGWAEQFTINNIKNFLQNGFQYLYFADYINNPNGGDNFEAYQKSGMIDAYLFISGYMKSQI